MARIESVYLKQIHERNLIEHAQKTVIADLIDTQKELRLEQYKFKICNKQSELLSKVAELEAGLLEKSNELKSLQV